MGESPLGRSIDLMMGGGTRHFLPKSKGGKRTDNRNLMEEAVDHFGWKKIIHTREEFDRLPKSGKK